MATFHSFRRITFLYIVIHLLCFVHAAPASVLSASLTLEASPDSYLPVIPSSSASAQAQEQHPHKLVRREKFVLRTNSTGGLEAFNADTLQEIPQGVASDGAGKDFDVPAILWLAYCAVVGLPMMFAGFRGGRVSAGVGLGVGVALGAWASIINSMGPESLNDLVIVLVALGFFLFGALVGFLRFGMHIGMVIIGILGGLAVGVRLVIIKSELLVSGLEQYAANWGLIAAFGMVTGAMVVWKRTQRWSVVFGCASIGTFLVFLGVDLIINRQKGMSRGLRFLFDRNSNHIVDIVSTGYEPPLVTQILLGISLGVTPIFAYAQHRFFTRPFLPTKDISYVDPTMGTYVNEPESVVVVHSSTTVSADPVSSKHHFRAGSIIPDSLRNSRFGEWFRGSLRLEPGRPTAAAAQMAQRPMEQQHARGGSLVQNIFGYRRRDVN
ncbi:hypothetical protein MD484_g8652, partial [Candolleomyces efflorescens]